MKKLLKIPILIYSIILLIFMHTNITYADTVSDTVTILPDGTRIETTIIEINSNHLSRSSGSKTVSKSDIISKNNTVYATYTLTATFTYNGTTSSCIAASCSISISDDSWKFVSETASKSGNKAIGNYTAKKYFLGIPVQIIQNTITITCDKNGNIS